MVEDSGRLRFSTDEILLMTRGEVDDRSDGQDDSGLADRVAAGFTTEVSGDFTVDIAPDPDDYPMVELSGYQFTPDMSFDVDTDY